MGKGWKIIAAVLLTVQLCSCSDAKVSKGDDVQIVTSFFPVYLIAQAVTHDARGVTVHNMTQPQTGCLHDYTLLPQDIKRLEDADIFVINGLGMEGFLDKVTQTLPNLDVIELSKGIVPIGGNPHVWLSPQHAKQMAQTLQQQLSKVDPANAQRYRSNTAIFCAKLDKLDAQMREKLQGITTRDIVTFHEAYAYFAQTFDLTVRATIEREPGEEPTPKELKETIDLVQQLGVKALFVEPAYSPTAARAISEQTGAQLYELDPITTGTEQQTNEEYFKRMSANADTLAKALR